MTGLAHNWKNLALKSYTAWAFYALVLITIAPDIIYNIFGIDTNPFVWGSLQILVCLAGLAGRLILQPQANKWRRRAILAGIVAIAIGLSFPALANSSTKLDPKPPEFDEVAFSLISKWEGKRNYSYRDMVGVWTVCYGHTRTAKPGQSLSDTQCRDLLIEEIAQYRRGLHRYFNVETRLYRLPVTRDAAYTSLAYNVGVQAAGKSTATRRLNAGDVVGGCNAISWWNRAGGRRVRGLARRRSEERNYCLRGT